MEKKRIWRRNEEQAIRRALAAVDHCKTLLRESNREGAREARGCVADAQGSLTRALIVLGDGVVVDRPRRRLWSVE